MRLQEYILAFVSMDLDGKDALGDVPWTRSNLRLFKDDENIFVGFLPRDPDASTLATRPMY